MLSNYFGPHEIVPGLWLGDFQDAQLLAQQGVVPVCVLEDIPRDEPRSAYWVPILVGGKKGTKAKHEQLDVAAGVIDWLLGQNRRVIVHCAAGIERSPLTVVWYLMKKRGMTLDEAYGLVKGKRPQVEDRRKWLRKDGHDYFGLFSYWPPEGSEEWLFLK